MHDDVYSVACGAIAMSRYINYSKQPGQNQINRDALSKNSFNSRAPRINYVSQLAAAAVRIGTLARRSRQPPAPHIQMTHVCVCALESVNGGQQWGEIVLVRITFK